MSHEAYRRAASANPRDAEYRAFAEATGLLLKAGEAGRSDLKSLIHAIHLNRQLWGALAGDCADERNALPQQTRAQIIALARFVSSYSSDVMRKGESLDPLIEINRLIMEGLAAQAPAA